MHADVAPVAPAALAAPLDIAASQDQDMADSSKEPTAAEVKAAAAAEAAQAGAGAAKAALQEQLQAVTQLLADVLAANNAAPRDEQVEGQDLVLNVELLERQLQQVGSYGAVAVHSDMPPCPFVAIQVVI